MMIQLQHLVVCLTLAVCVTSGQEYVPSGGPVYVNPAAQQAQQAQVVAEGKSNNEEPLLTQTVYGFLDFTTTIGNTIMVFLPQSAPAAAAETVSPPVTSSAPVIETRPPVTATVAPPLVIKPSKITEKKGWDIVNKKPQVAEVKLEAPQEVKLEAPQEVKLQAPQEVKQAPVVSSVVQVVEAPASRPEEPKDIFTIPSNVVVFSKVEVRGGNSQIVNVVQKEEATEITAPRILSSVVEITGGSPTAKVDDPPRVMSSIVQVISSPDPVTVQQEPIIFSSHVEISEQEVKDEPAIQGNNIIEPEYDFLSRQPAEVVDETYKVINLRPSSKFHLKPRASPRATDDQPTGVVTRMGGTIVKDGATTIHETKVIGTFISGKYTQVLQSSSKIKPTAAGKQLKTVGPNFVKGRIPHVDPSAAASSFEDTALPLEALFSSASNTNQIRSPKSLGGGGGQRNRFNLRNKVQDSREQEIDNNEDDDYVEPPPKKQQSKAVRTTQAQRNGYRSTKGYAKLGRTSSTTPELATVSVFTGDQSSSSPASRYNKQRRPSNAGYRPQSPTTSPPENNSFSNRRFKPKFQASPVEQDHGRSSSTSLYKFKLARPQGRWSYKTTPKPRVTIRKLDEGLENVTATTPATSPQFVPEQRAELRERTDDLDETNGDEIDGEVAEVRSVSADQHKEPVAAAETIKVEISTPADFKDVYYEIATIRSPYTFQVGTVKNTRFITVTSTLEKSLVESTSSADINPSSTLNEPLTENILSTLAPHYTHTLPLDSSVATLPPIALASDMETPPLETLTETFSTTQQLLKTHILPVVRHGSDTSLYTLVQSYNITRFVTAIKTLPPMEAYHFHPSRTLTDLNTRLEEAGSELHLELEFGDENDSDQPAALRALRPDIDLANIGSELDISDIDKLNLPDGPLRYKKTPEPLPKIASSIPKQEAPQYSPEQLQQLALLRYLNPAAAAAALPPQYVTSSRPIIKLETVYESHVLPLFDGVSTHYSTLSRPVGTITKTEYEYVTSTIQQPLPNLNQLFPQAPPQFQQPQFQQPQFQQPQFQVTSSPVVTQTMLTQTQSKILKLTFGAKTQFTTIYSTKVVPTILTTYVTASVPVQQPAAFNPYFPSPFQQIPQFPYVG